MTRAERRSAVNRKAARSRNLLDRNNPARELRRRDEQMRAFFLRQLFGKDRSYWFGR